MTSTHSQQKFFFSEFFSVAFIKFGFFFYLFNFSFAFLFQFLVLSIVFFINLKNSWGKMVSRKYYFLEPPVTLIG